MSRPRVKQAVLLAIATHDGKWSWYQLDRALSGSTSECVGPFRDEVNELVAEGLIEIRPVLDPPRNLRYWMTERGKAAAMRDGSAVSASKSQPGLKKNGEEDRETQQ